MPYKSINDLPESVKNHLPVHAQEIYLQAFNHALKEYEDKNNRRTNESLEETAYKVAWSAVKEAYHKDSGGKWVKN